MAVVFIIAITTILTVKAAHYEAPTNVNMINVVFPMTDRITTISPSSH